MTAGSVTFVVAWVVGLALQPAGTTGRDDAAANVAHYTAHRAASLGQELLVHGLAAVGLAAFTVGLARLASSSRRPAAARRIRWGGLAAATLSLVQVAIGVAMIATAGSAAESTTHRMLLTVERLDAVKLVSLAVLSAGTATLARSGALRRWVGTVAVAAATFLAAAAVGMSGLLPGLAGAAVPALVLLLAWIGGAPWGRSRPVDLLAISARGEARS